MGTPICADVGGFARNRKIWIKCVFRVCFYSLDNFNGLKLQVDKDLKEKSDQLLNQEVDLEKPGFAQNYCLHCAKYFIDKRAMEDHFKTKVRHG